MTNEPKASRISYRGTPELRRRLRSLAAENDTSVQQILDMAVSAYLSEKADVTIHAVPTIEDPEILPANDRERNILKATLLFLRQERESGPQLIELLETLLKDQLEQVAPKNNKRRA